MTDKTDVTLALINAKSKVDIQQGLFVSAGVGSCVVQVGDSQFPAMYGTAWMPEVSEPVWVWIIDGNPYLMGPLAGKATRGTVVSVASNLATLTSDLGTTVVAPYAGSAPTAGQIMKLSWHGGPFAQLMSTSPAPAAPPAGGGSGATKHVDTFTAIDSGSNNGSSWWTSQVWASDSNLGAWFYGTKIADTIPAGAVVSKVQIYLSPTQLSGANPIFATHPHTTKPGGAPSLSNGTAFNVGGAGWGDCPSAWNSLFPHGGGMAGIGVAHGGYNIFNSLASDGMSGAIRIYSTY